MKGRGWSLPALVVAACSAGEQPTTAAVEPAVETRHDYPHGSARPCREAIASPDPKVRAGAVEMVPGDPGDDGLEVLQRLMSRDGDPVVRERAVLMYSQLAGASAVPLLRELALSDRDEAVVATAM